jgi:hypothetical protein
MHPKTDRRYFGSMQIRCIHQLLEGETYLEVDESGAILSPFEVVERPCFHQISEPSGWVVKISNSQQNEPFFVELSAYGFFKKEDGTRKNDKWISFTEESVHRLKKICEKTFCGDSFDK